MDTKNEEWQDSNHAENTGFNRDGNKISDEERKTISRSGSFGSDSDGSRPHRPRINSVYRSNGTSNYRPRYENNEGGADGTTENRPYRPRYNSGNRDNNSGYNNGGYNNGGGYRPRYNNNDQEGGGQRPYRPRYNSEGRDNNGGYNNNGGGYRPRYNNNGQENGGQRPYRPRYNSEGRDNNGGYNNGGGYNNNGGGYNNGGYRPRYNNSNNGGYGNDGYNNGGYNNGGQRPFRPRPNNNYRQQGGGFRPRSNDYDPNAKYSVRKQIEYKELNVDPNEPIRLNKFLANAGICSRREADEFIQAGVVSVNGVVVSEL